MIKLRFTILSLIAAALSTQTACTDQTESLPALTGTPRFVLHSTNAYSRVSYPTNDYTHSAFEEGDIVGAFVLDGNNVVPGTTANARYKIAGTAESSQTLEPELPQDAFPADASYTYIFYYPYKTGTIYSNVTHKVEADQRLQTWTDEDEIPHETHARYEQSDLLWDVAKGTDNNGTLTVNVEMNHAMSSIILEVPTEMMYSEDPQAQILGIKSLVAGINLLTESSEKPTGNMETVLSQNINMWLFTTTIIDEKDMYVFRAVIPAQTISNGTNMFHIQTGENDYKTYTAQFTGTGITFIPGKYYRFTVTETGLRFRGLIEDLKNGGDYYYEY